MSVLGVSWLLTRMGSARCFVMYNTSACEWKLKRPLRTETYANQMFFPYTPGPASVSPRSFRPYSAQVSVDSAVVDVNKIGSIRSSKSVGTTEGHGENALSLVELAWNPDDADPSTRSLTFPSITKFHRSSTSTQPASYYLNPCYGLHHNRLYSRCPYQSVSTSTNITRELDKLSLANLNDDSRRGSRRSNK